MLFPASTRRYTILSHFSGNLNVFIVLDIVDRKFVKVYTSAKQVELPAVGSLVGVIVTTIVSPTKFFVQLPLGSKSVLSKSTNKCMLIYIMSHCPSHMHTDISTGNINLDYCFRKVLKDMRYAY